MLSIMIDIDNILEKTTTNIPNVSNKAKSLTFTR
jgi:hypothetical protein